MLMASSHSGNYYLNCASRVSIGCSHIQCLVSCSFGGTDFPVDDIAAACLLVRIMHVCYTQTN